MIESVNKLKTPFHEIKFFYQINEELEFFHFSVQNPGFLFEVTLPKPLLFQTTKYLGAKCLILNVLFKS